MSCKTSNFSIDKVKPHQLVKLRGHLYNLYGENGLWIFKEGKRNSNNRNYNSFIVNIARHDLGYAFIEDIYGIGDKTVGQIRDKRNNKVLLDTIQHFYCQITAHPIRTGIKMDSCDYQIKIDNQFINLSCVYFDNYLVDVQPLDSLPRAKYLKALNGFMPGWAR